MNIGKNFTTGALTLWWTLWIINNVLGQIIYRYTADATSIDQLTTSTILNIIDKVIEIPLALITIKIIKDYSQIEPLLIETEESKKQLEPTPILVESN
ncbi:DUF4328 domain-containing protein [Flavobacterium sp. 140616W15]|nr:DUF4328 domain-containing protein [Flavobacterium sp. 140616W15]